MNDSERLQGLEQQLKATDESIERQTAAVDEHKALVKQANQLRKDAEAALQEAIANAEQATTKQQKMLHLLAQEKIKAVSLTEDWNGLKRKMAIDELYAKQPEVWDVLPKRMRIHQEAHKSNLVGIDDKEVDIDELVARWRSSESDTRPNFSHWDIEFRSMTNSYREAVMRVCEMSVDAQKIPLNVRQLPNKIIDGWLLRPEIMQLWSM